MIDAKQMSKYFVYKFFDGAEKANRYMIRNKGCPNNFLLGKLPPVRVRVRVIVGRRAFLRGGSCPRTE